MPKRSSKPKRPADTNQLAKLIAGIATGETKEKPAAKKKRPVSPKKKGKR